MRRNFTSYSDDELFEQLAVIREVATTVKEKTGKGQALTPAAEIAARITMSDTRSIIEELHRRGYGQRGEQE